MPLYDSLVFNLQFSILIITRDIDGVDHAIGLSISEF